MKKILEIALTILLALSMFTSCAANAGNKPANMQTSTPSAKSGDPASTPVADKGDEAKASADKKAEVIYASALLSMEDAAKILEAEMFDANFSGNKIDKAGSSVGSSAKNIECEYWTDGCSVNITLYQDEADYIRMMSGIVDRQIENPPKETISTYTALEGIGDKAYISQMINGGASTVGIFYGDYYLTVTMLGNSTVDDAWKQEKATECGKLALEHLKEVLAGKRSGEAVVPVSELGSAIDEAAKKATSEIITPSMLITPEEAGRILGGDLSVMEGYDENIGSDGVLGSRTSYITSIYSSETSVFFITVYQDALLEEKGEKDTLKKGGIAYYIKDRMGTLDAMKSDPSVALPAEGIGDGGTYCKVEGNWTLYFYYGAYWINISCGQEVKNFSDKGAYEQWQREKLIELGEVIVGNLKKRIG